VIIAFETAVAEARVEGKDLADHLSHLVVHGMLHLLGYDHETNDEADEMESMEVAVLASVGVADPYSAASINPK
jgi:probable rRNA maturation factor